MEKWTTDAKKYKIQRKKTAKCYCQEWFCFFHGSFRESIGRMNVGRRGSRKNGYGNSASKFENFETLKIFIERV